jgi:Pentapeptide repeats (8 copies)
MYLYLHLYMQRLWTELAALPAIFPDGKPIYEKVEPWLLNGLVRAHFTRLRDERPLTSYLENAVSIVLAWWALPFTLAAFWLRYLPKHDWPGTAFHLILFAVTVHAALGFHALAKRTLRGDPARNFRWKRPWAGFNPYRAAVSALTAIVFVLLSVGTIEGGSNPNGSRPKEIVLGALWEFRTYANLNGVDLSTKPVGYTGLAERAKPELAQIKGASLSGADLRGADASWAFLVKASLVATHLQGAHLIRANLQGAYLFLADLRDADLLFVNLQDADLTGADLKDADLGGADLRRADLSTARSLVQEQLEGACGDETTKLPSGLTIKHCP